MASLLQVPADDLGSALVAEVTTTRGEHIRRDRSVAQAADCRDALTKAVYGRLFSWIVNSINQVRAAAGRGDPSTVDASLLCRIGLS